MKIHKYKGGYSEYVKSQKTANAKKSSNVWAVEENIKFLCGYLHGKIKPKTGICHGTRGGHEQKWFNEWLPTCKTVGTEIGDASAPNTIQWDFNKVHPAWLDKFDFIYSNSFDHAYNPKLTLSTVWANQLHKGGLIILEYDRRQEHTGEISMPVNKDDPVSITVGELIDLIPKWSSSMRVIDVLDMPVVTQEWRKSVVIKVVGYGKNIL